MTRAIIGWLHGWRTALIYLDARRNPVARAERLRIERVPAQRSFWQRLSRLLNRLTTALAMALAGVYILLSFVIVWLPPDDILRRPDLQETVEVTSGLLIGLTFLINAGFSRRAQLGITESIRREHTAKTWEMLILTGMTARQLVLGKWWGVVVASWRDLLLLVVLRIGTIFAITAVLIPLVRYSDMLTLTGAYPPSSLIPPRLPAWRDLLLAAGMIAVLTPLNFLMITMFSLIATVNRAALSCGGCGLQAGCGCGVLSVMTLFLFLGIMFAFFARFTAFGWPPGTVVLGLAAVSQFDSGLFLTGFLAHPYDTYEGYYLLAFGLTVLLQTLLLMAGLRTAERIMRWQGAV